MEEYDDFTMNEYIEVVTENDIDENNYNIVNELPTERPYNELGQLQEHNNTEMQIVEQSNAPRNRCVNIKKWHIGMAVLAALLAAVTLTFVFVQLTGQGQGEKLDITSCDDPLIVNGLQYTSASQPVLFGVIIGCATTNDGYSFSGVGTTYYCQSNGEWALLQDNCNGFAYKIYQNDLTTTWNVSRQRCISDGADLAIVDTQEKFEALSNAVANHVSELNSPYYFIGMTDKAMEGTFVWINGKPVVYDGWDDGQPANWKSKQHCGIYEKTSAKWHDFNCDTDCNYICAKIIT